MDNDKFNQASIAETNGDGRRKLPAYYAGAKAGEPAGHATVPLHLLNAASVANIQPRRQGESVPKAPQFESADASAIEAARAEVVEAANAHIAELHDKYAEEIAGVREQTAADAAELAALREEKASRGAADAAGLALAGGAAPTAAGGAWGGNQ